MGSQRVSRTGLLRLVGRFRRATGAGADGGAGRVC